MKFYYLVESMIAFASEKEISFRILLIIEKKRGSGNSAAKSAMKLFQFLEWRIMDFCLFGTLIRLY